MGTAPRLALYLVDAEQFLPLLHEKPFRLIQLAQIGWAFKIEIEYQAIGLYEMSCKGGLAALSRSGNCRDRIVFQPIPDLNSHINTSLSGISGQPRFQIAENPDRSRKLTVPVCGIDILLKKLSRNVSYRNQPDMPP